MLILIFVLGKIRWLYVYTTYGVELRTTIMPKRDAIIPNDVYLYGKLEVIGITESGGAIVEEPDGHRGNF